LEKKVMSLVTGMGSSTVFVGTAQDNTIDLSAGSPLIIPGGAGLPETIHAGEGNDFVVGTAQNDSVFGGLGNDGLFPDGGNDAIEGGPGNDTINGGIGNDAIVGADGNDTLTGGGGNDVFVFTGNFGNDTISDFNAGDTIRFDHAVNGVQTAGGGAVFTDNFGNSVTLTGPSAAAALANQPVPFVYTGSVTVAGAGAADPNFTVGTIVGTDGNDTINQVGVGAGATILAEGGSDIIYASSFNDVLYGGDAADSIYGFGGNDVILGGTGNDAVDGGDGVDVIDGGAGNDGLTGGAGADEFNFTGNWGNDTITDFGTGADALWFDHAVNANFTSTGNILITDNFGNSVLLQTTTPFTTPPGVSYHVFSDPGHDPIL
jgi:Ca2+-binding RTX toxin-like protein